jgi:hypothetical protein
MKVKFIKPGAGYGYAHFVGDVTEIDDIEAAKLVADGICAIAEPVEGGCLLPEDLPFRKILESAGISDIDALKAVEDLTTIKGIGEASAKAIADYLAKIEA